MDDGDDDVLNLTISSLFLLLYCLSFLSLPHTLRFLWIRVYYYLFWVWAWGDIVNFVVLCLCCDSDGWRDRMIPYSICWYMGLHQQHAAKGQIHTCH